MRSPFILLLLPLVACVDAREPAPLVDHEAWTPADPAADPWADHAPAVLDCSPLSWGAEDEGGLPAFGVDTAACNFLAVVQPSLAAIAAGDSVSVRLWHYDLYAGEVAEGHAGLSLGGQVLAEFTVPIPRDAEMLTALVPIDEDVPAGTEILFHLHNHGANSWSLVDVEDRAPE